VFVLSLELQVRIPAARSLKDRRQVLRPILDGARHRFKVSAAEVDGQGSWQRAGLGFAVVASSHRGAVETIDAVERFVWSFPEVEVLDAIRTWSE